METEEEIVSDISSDLILENKSTNEENVLNGEEDIAINAENYIEEQVSKVQDESKATVVEPEEELSCKEKPESIETEDDTVLVDNEKKQNITDESSGDDEQDLPENKEDNVLEVTSPDDSTEDQSDSDQKSFANNKELSSEEEKEFAVNQERVAQQPDDEATEVTGKKPETSTNDRDNDSFTEKSNEEKVAESDSLAAVVDKDVNTATRTGKTEKPITSSEGKTKKKKSPAKRALFVLLLLILLSVVGIFFFREKLIGQKENVPSQETTEKVEDVPEPGVTEEPEKEYTKKDLRRAFDWKRYEEAVEIYSYFCKKDPKNPVRYTQRADTCIEHLVTEKDISVMTEEERKYYDLAVSDYNTAISLRPDYYQYYYALAKIHNSHGESEKAVAVLKEGYEKTDSEELKKCLDDIGNLEKEEPVKEEKVVESNSTDSNMKDENTVNQQRVASLLNQDYDRYSNRAKYGYDDSQYQSDVFEVTKYQISENDNGDYEVSISVIMPVGYEVAIFDAPDGNTFMYRGKTTVNGLNEYCFTINKDLYNQVSEITISIAKADDDRCFLFVKRPR